MSSYIVTDKTINTIVTWLDLTKHTHSKAILDKFKIDLEDSKGRQELAQKLMDMNSEAVNQRYGVNLKPPTIEFKTELSSQIQVFKSLNCITYQCAEGTVTKKKLFKFLEEVERKLAYAIVTEMPEYDRAKWNIGADGQ